MTLSGAIGNLQAKALTLTGMKAAPTEPPEAMNQFPFTVSYPKSGSLTLQSAGFGTYLHTIICEVHVGRISLARAVSQAIPYVEEMVSKLIGDPTLGGTVAAVNAVRYEFGRVVWGGEEHIGVRFEVDVKILQE